MSKCCSPYLCRDILRETLGRERVKVFCLSAVLHTCVETLYSFRVLSPLRRVEHLLWEDWEGGGGGTHAVIMIIKGISERNNQAGGEYIAIVRDNICAHVKTPSLALANQTIVWSYETTAHAIFKTECGCPRNREIENGHIRNSSSPKRQGKRNNKLNKNGCATGI